MAKIMDMEFPDDCVPDFGSIHLCGVEGYMRYYILLSKDLDKLSLLSNAYDGSAARCVDTQETYIKLGDTWYKQ